MKHKMKKYQTFFLPKEFLKLFVDSRNEIQSAIDALPKKAIMTGRIHKRTNNLRKTFPNAVHCFL